MGMASNICPLVFIAFSHFQHLPLHGQPTGGTTTGQPSSETSKPCDIPWVGWLVIYQGGTFCRRSGGLPCDLIRWILDLPLIFIHIRPLGGS
ncbi:hypothetical protein FA15DRAFT_111116 [Coprinopsis marcescibilis]|uniref:Uncharacterized protein n=1 Tax=Coprinopsis marcescibilis TaxID=230819 RepID=A0A5C3KKQ5_COPMA|nr:hypothetical protein FA15DRAFT_111116 [Coprinopsis marcescibilis]